MNLPTEQGGRRFRRVLVVGLLASVALHAAVFLLWRGDPLPGAAPGHDGAPTAELRTPDRALEAVALAPLRSREIPEPPRPVPDPDAPVVDPPETEEFARSSLVSPRPDAPGSEMGRAGRQGRADAGAGRGTAVPVPRSVFPEWDPPAEVRGLRVTVHVHVDAEGRPTGKARLEPPTPSRGFNRLLLEKVGQMEFYPARRGGEPVEGWAEITFVF